MEINIVNTWPPPTWTYFIPAFLVFLAPIGVWVLRNRLHEVRGFMRGPVILLHLVAGMSIPLALMFCVGLALAVVVGIPQFLYWAVRTTFG